MTDTPGTVSSDAPDALSRAASDAYTRADANTEQALPAAPNIPAPVFDPVEVADDAAALSLEDKVEYLYALARKLENLVDSITPEQLEKVQKITSNPLMRKLIGN